MTDKQTYWLVDQTGKKAQVSGTAERDRWLPLGWAETEEPSGNEFVYARKDGIAEPGLFSAAAFDELWRPRGWEPCAPPEPVSPFNGDQLPEPAATPPAGPSAAETTSSTPKPTSAAGGNTKEK